MLVCLPADGAYGAAVYANSGLSTQNAITSALSTSGLDVVKGTTVSEMSEAKAEGKQRQVAWIVLPIIHEWEDRSTEWSGLPDRIKIEIRTINSRTGALIDSTTVSGASKWATFGGDHPQDMLAPALKPWIKSILAK